MMAIIASVGVIVLAICLIRWVASVPIIRTLTVSIDQWADGVQGSEPGPIAE